METNDSLTFENEELHVTLKKEPGCKIHLDVDVKPAATLASYKKAIEAIRKEVSIPGFRKGKAPEKIVTQNYLKHVEKEWRDILLNTSLNDAVKLIKIYPFNQVQSASILSASKEEGAKLSFSYESTPNVPSIHPETLLIPQVELKLVTDADVQETLEDLTLQSGEWNTITDRPVQEGDFVSIDIDDIGESPKNICTNSAFEVKKTKMGQWMIDLLVGMTTGQTAEKMSEEDTHHKDCSACEEGGDEGHQHPEFVPTLCRIHLNEIKEPKRHPLDDTLAKKYGADTVELLKERAKQMLEKRALEEHKNQERYLIENQILNHYPFEIPSSLIHEELKNVKKRATSELRAQFLKESDINSQLKKIEQEATQRYQRDYHLYFLVQKFASEQKIEVTEDEISFEVMKQFWLKRNQGEVDSLPDRKETANRARLELLMIKGLDCMIEKAQRQEKKA